jgi:hypothetical protein
LIEQQQHEGPTHPQVDEQLALENGIFEDEHEELRSAEFEMQNATAEEQLETRPTAMIQLTASHCYNRGAVVGYA